MKTTSVDQRLALLAALGANAGWDQITVEEAQLGIAEGQRAGAEFTLFVKNGFRTQVADFFRDTGELTIPIPALPRPTLAELQAKDATIEFIERDTSTTEAVTLKLGTVLRPDEETITANEYELRLKPELNRVLGYQHAKWLEEHQDKFPEFMALLGKIYIDFPGLVVVHSGGRRRCPYLGRGGKRWKQRWIWISLGFDRHGRVACK